MYTVDATAINGIINGEIEAIADEIVSGLGAVQSAKILDRVKRSLRTVSKETLNQRLKVIADGNDNKTQTFTFTVPSGTTEYISDDINLDQSYPVCLGFAVIPYGTPPADWAVTMKSNATAILQRANYQLYSFDRSAPMDKRLVPCKFNAKPTAKIESHFQTATPSTFVFDAIFFCIR